MDNFNVQSFLKEAYGKYDILSEYDKAFKFDLIDEVYKLLDIGTVDFPLTAKDMLTRK